MVLPSDGPNPDPNYVWFQGIQYGNPPAPQPVDYTGGGRGNLPSPTGPTPPSLATPKGSPLNPSTPGPIPNPLNLIPGLQQSEELAAVVATIGKHMLNPKMWRSLAWLLLGVWTMYLGILLWLKNPIEEAVGTTLGAAVKAV
jgi:hypothetical protein